VLAAEAVANLERKKRFVAEARAASALNHPNSITVYDINTVDGIGLDRVARPEPDTPPPCLRPPAVR
jgi:hypothetical protein